MGKILTVSIAAYQMEDYIRQALDSLTEPAVIGDLEVFVIDGGGTDRTLEIAREYAKRYPGSIFPVHKENGGYGSTVNYGIRHASGKYFRLLDGDDWFVRENLPGFVGLLRGIEADCVISPWINHYERKRGSREVLADRYASLRDGLYGFGDSRLASLLLIMYAVTFRTSVLRDMGRPITEYCFYTDNEYLLYPMPFIRNVYIWNRPLYVYRIGREGQSMGLAGVKKHYKEHGKVVRHVVQVRERMEEGPLKTAVEERLCLIIAEEFKFLCYFPMSRRRLREMGQLYRRCGRLCPDLLRKTEKRFNFVMLYARSHGLLYPFMRLFALLYACRLLDPVLRFRDRMRNKARVI